MNNLLLFTICFKIFNLSFDVWAEGSDDVARCCSENTPIIWITWHRHDLAFTFPLWCRLNIKYVNLDNLPQMNMLVLEAEMRAWLRFLMGREGSRRDSKFHWDWAPYRSYCCETGQQANPGHLELFGNHPSVVNIYIWNSCCNKTLCSKLVTDDPSTRKREAVSGTGRQQGRSEAAAAMTQNQQQQLGDSFLQWRHGAWQPIAATAGTFSQWG